jgi:hypothetical protein
MSAVWLTGLPVAKATARRCKTGSRSSGPPAVTMLSVWTIELSLERNAVTRTREVPLRWTMCVTRTRSACTGRPRSTASCGVGSWSIGCPGTLTTEKRPVLIR